MKPTLPITALAMPLTAPTPALAQDLYLTSNTVVVDAYISGDELTETNTGAIKVVEYCF